MKNKIVPYILAMMLAIASIYSTVGAEFTIDGSEATITGEALNSYSKAPITTRNGQVRTLSRTMAAGAVYFYDCPHCGDVAITIREPNAPSLYYWRDITLGGYTYIGGSITSNKYGFNSTGILDITNDIYYNPQFAVRNPDGTSYSGSCRSGHYTYAVDPTSWSDPVPVPATVETYIQNVNTLNIKNCATTAVNLSGSEKLKLIIDGGNYSNSSGVALGGGTNTIVKRGTITDFNGTSNFMIDIDSEATVATSGNKTITTVKLSNPPVIIDWGDFPGLDLDIDLSAPTIEVTRNPASTTTPTSQVTLTIRATDPNGADDPKPISINGGTFQASPATFTATQNQLVSIVARDANGNTREYQVSIDNIDTAAPEITGFTSSNESWTKNPVRVYCNATDDVKLHDTAYKFEFHPNSGGATVTTAWQSDRSYLVNESGTLYCYVRDALGKQTKSDVFYVNNIDKTAPTATYTLSPASNVKVNPDEGVEISLNIVNTGDRVTQDASPLATAAVKWSNTESWSEDTTRRVYANGVYNIQVRDSVGNVSANIPITVSNISTDKPVITSLTGTHLDKAYAMAPVTLSVTARGGGSTPLADKPYSWDGGKTWTSLSTMKIHENGEYIVMVKDQVGSTTEESIIVSNIDPVSPTASIYLFKGLPDDATPDMTVDDYVWKIRVEAADIGSGVSRVETLWDGGSHSTLPIIQDIEEAGVYGIIVYDEAGNQTYAEKVVTNEAIGNATGSSNGAYVEIQVPESGSAGEYFGAALGDLVFGPTGAYNKIDGTFKTYQSGAEGITVNLIVNAKSGTTVSGYATFDSVKYPVTFDGATTTRGKKNINAEVFIPFSNLTTDVRNGRLVVVLQEYKGDKLDREGSATLYTSAQVSDPKINYTYNRGTDELTLVATSAVAGIKAQTYKLGSGGDQAYTAPFTVGGAGEVTLTAVDNVNNTTQIVLDGDTLPVTGEGGGSLPTEGITSGSINSYYISGRSSEVYIIGGPRSNTNNVPSGSVFSSITG